MKIKTKVIIGGLVIFGLVVLIGLIIVLTKNKDGIRYELKENSSCPILECGNTITETRKVYCVIDGTDTEVDISLCSGSKPETTRQCVGNQCDNGKNCVEGACIDSEAPCNKNGNSSPPSLGHGGVWEPAYFISGGSEGVYTESDLRKNTTSTDLEGGAPNGADPSCGSADSKTWVKCDLGSENNKYGITHTLAYQQIMEQAGDSVCIDCDGKDGDCNGHIILQDEDNDGKVSVLAHGGFGGLPSVWLEGDSPRAVCTTSHFGCDYDENSYGSFVIKFNYIAEKGVTDPSLSSYLKLYEPTNSTLITKQAFIESGLENVWNGLGTVANEGVALSWGHGFYGHGCGDLVFVKQGPTMVPGTSHPNNVALNLQIGTRAWSGEMSDTPGGHQGYIVEGLDDAEDSASCLQPLTVPFSAADANTLFTFLCNKSSNTYACKIDTSSGSCTYVGPEPDPGQCITITNEDICKSVATAWNCSWEG